MLSCVNVVGTLAPGPVVMTMMYVFPVNMSMKAENCEFRTSMPWNCDCVFEQLNLNCLMMLEIRSKRCVSYCWELRGEVTESVCTQQEEEVCGEQNDGGWQHTTTPLTRAWRCAR